MKKKEIKEKAVNLVKKHRSLSVLIICLIILEGMRSLGFVWDMQVSLIRFIAFLIAVGIIIEIVNWLEMK